MSIPHRLKPIFMSIGGLQAHINSESLGGIQKTSPPWRPEMVDSALPKLSDLWFQNDLFLECGLKVFGFVSGLPMARDRNNLVRSNHCTHRNPDVTLLHERGVVACRRRMRWCCSSRQSHRGEREPHPGSRHALVLPRSPAGHPHDRPARWSGLRHLLSSA